MKGRARNDQIDGRIYDPQGNIRGNRFSGRHLRRSRLRDVNILGTQTHLFLWVSLVIALSDILFVWINYQAAQDRFRGHLERQAQNLQELFEVEVGNASMRMLQTASFIAAMPQVQQIFHAGRQAAEAEGGGAGGAGAQVERQRLLALVEPSWHQLRERFDVRQLHFQYGANATSFLRVHAVDRYGDSLEGVRHTIFAALRGQKETLGFECGRILCGLRAVVPVYLGGTGQPGAPFVGVLENGTSFRTVLDQLEKPTQARFAVLLSLPHLQETYFPDKLSALLQKNPAIQGHIIEASLHPEIRRHLSMPKVGDLLPESNKTAPIWLEVDGRQLAFAAFPLRDYLGNQDISRAPVGKVLVWFDVSTDIAQSRQDVMDNVAYAIVAFLILEILLFFSLGGLIRRLNAVIAAQTERLQDYSECSADWFWEMDEDLRFSFLSSNFERHSGEKPEAILGRHCPALLHGAPGLEGCEETLVHRRPFRDFEYSVQDSTGGFRWLSISGMPVFGEEGRFAGYRGVGRVITLHKEAEQALQAGKQAAENAAQAKATFLANMSHEIRNPLNAVLGFARMGLRDSRNLLDRQRWQHVTDAGSHLMHVINDILDFSRIDAGKFSIEARPFRLSAIIENACLLVADAAYQKGLSCTRDEECPNLDIWVLGDGPRLQQILINLLSNAVKFTPSGEVRLRIARDGEKTFFRIVDTGIGMTQEQISRLFQPFEQADSTITRRFGGTGLGLAISYKLARLMDGDITVDSAPGHGSAFTLCLPLPETAPLPDSAATVTVPESQRLLGLRVLAAEDVDVNRMILEDMLGYEGAITTFACNGREALDTWRTAGPAAFDIILMDIQMPDMDGLEATRRILALTPGQAIIGLTAHALQEERDKCMKAGMREHVTKPVDPDTLVAAILRHAQWPGGTTLSKQPPRAASSTSVPLEWQVLVAHYGGRTRFVKKLVTNLLASYETTPDILRTLAAQQDLPGLAKVAHTLKGMAGNLLATEVQSLATRTDDAARAGSLEATETALELADHFQFLMQTLRQGLGQADQAPGNEEGPEQPTMTPDATDKP